MCLKNAENLGVFPMEAVVKIGDTLPDVAEGLNAGMWTIGLAKTGNEVGMNAEEVEQADPEILEYKLDRARTRMAQSGAHYVVDGIWDCDPILDDINARLARGERP
jgi:phosphonoacetaldehyde hydrolase